LEVALELREFLEAIGEVLTFHDVAVAKWIIHAAQSSVTTGYPATGYPATG
jgi:hypothetical protein